jgi:hypothetical protein
MLLRLHKLCTKVRVPTAMSTKRRITVVVYTLAFIITARCRDSWICAQKTGGHAADRRQLDVLNRARTTADVNLSVLSLT